MKKLVLMVIAACALAIPASAMAGRADSTVTLTCIDKTTLAVIFSVTADANSTQGQQQTIQAMLDHLALRLNAFCFIE
jgi:hypothetical protein